MREISRARLITSRADETILHLSEVFCVSTLITWNWLLSIKKLQPSYRNTDIRASSHIASVHTHNNGLIVGF